MSKFQYDDILNYKYPNPEIEKDFTEAVLRAAQFAPFAALTGHDAAIKETARLTDDRPELDEHKKSEINLRLMHLFDNADKDATVSITYFVPDEKKQGGEEKIAFGTVARLYDFEGIIVMDDDTEIPIDDILAIEGKIFEK